MPLDQVGEEKEMSFLEHLEELRWHVIRGVIAIFVFTITAFIGINFVMDTLIMGPSRVDFWTYKQLCLLAEVINSPSICVEELPFSLISRKLQGQFLLANDGQLI